MRNHIRACPRCLCLPAVATFVEVVSWWVEEDEAANRIGRAERGRVAEIENAVERARIALAQAGHGVDSFDEGKIAADTTAFLLL